MGRRLRAAGVALAALLLGAVMASARAHVEVRDAWVRGTVDGQTASAAYLTLRSDRDATLVGATCPAARGAAIHEMHLDGAVMRMRHIERLPLPAGQAVALDGRRWHLMLLGLRQPLRAGATLPLTLQFIDAAGRHDELHLQLPVRPLSTPAAPLE